MPVTEAFERRGTGGGTPPFVPFMHSRIGLRLDARVVLAFRSVSGRDTGDAELAVAQWRDLRSIGGAAQRRVGRLQRWLTESAKRTIYL